MKNPIRRLAIALTAIVATSAVGFAQNEPLKPSGTGQVPPRTWVDKDTGHRVWRMTDEPGSSGFYFNINAYTPDMKTMCLTPAFTAASMAAMFCAPRFPGSGCGHGSRNTIRRK